MAGFPLTLPQGLSGSFSARRAALFSAGKYFRKSARLGCLCARLQAWMAGRFIRLCRKTGCPGSWARLALRDSRRLVQKIRMGKTAGVLSNDLQDAEWKRAAADCPCRQAVFRILAQAA